MKSVIPNLDYNSKTPLYLQLYTYIKADILRGELLPNEKLPSLRQLSKSLEVSLTTISLAYNQLLMEGYINSKTNSGYYINKISVSHHASGFSSAELASDLPTPYQSSFMERPSSKEVKPYYDLSCFDFVKWKKCANVILNEYSSLLLYESDPQGEEALRLEICKYLYSSRGVVCKPEEIVIGAGTQQITGQLTILLSKIGIGHVSVEQPGYLPVLNIFRDRGFAMTSVSVGAEGIVISKLPANIRSAAYVNPSNQFPTGSIMPVGKRYELLAWASANDSLIIEDDYDSELRYFGKPIPAMQGLDQNQRVIYLGSFSSTLFASIKISYMVLPPSMVNIFQEVKLDYTQTCSKSEQLTLALFMSKGFYQTNIKKLRNLYSQKLQLTTSSLKKYGDDFILATNTASGINLILKVKSRKTPIILSHEAKSLGLSVFPIAIYTEDSEINAHSLVFYYNQIPLKDIDNAVSALAKVWRK